MIYYKFYNSINHNRFYLSFQMLYADTYMTGEEFRQMFDHKLYDRVRKRFNASKAFPEVYDKVNRYVRK